MLLTPPNACASGGLRSRQVRVGIPDAGVDLQLCGLMTVVSLRNRWLLEKAQAALGSRRSPFSTPKSLKPHSLSFERRRMCPQTLRATHSKTPASVTEQGRL
ncbi:unnamed protein product [Durusdinium trenchii]|uniref:Uncharacterized protein n=1 Tax=Durusdinium trenchii TaxID=1381693 RepID=A0ABP0QJM9_9DINO